MEPDQTPNNIWKQPLPSTPMGKPTWRRGQEGDTATRVPLPHDPPEHTVELPIGTLDGARRESLKRPYFKAFDAEEAQAAALATHTIRYDHDLLQHPLLKAKKRRDSIQDDDSAPSSSVSDNQPSTPSSSLPIQPKASAPAIILTTEPSSSSEGNSAAIPKELEIDGNAGFDPHHIGNHAERPKMTYQYKGRRYEYQGWEPAEWLKDLREVAPQPTPASTSSAQPRGQSRSSVTPNSMVSGVTARSRQSPRRSIGRTEDSERRRSGRRR